MSPVDYQRLEDLTVSHLQLLEQAYNRLYAEGQDVSWSFADFLDIVLGRGEHKYNEFREMESNKELARKQPRKIEVVHYEF